MTNDQPHRAKDVMTRVKLVHYDSVFSTKSYLSYVICEAMMACNPYMYQVWATALVKSGTHIYADIFKFSWLPLYHLRLGPPHRGATYTVVSLRDSSPHGDHHLSLLCLAKEMYIFLCSARRTPLFYALLVGPCATSSLLWHSHLPSKELTPLFDVLIFIFALERTDSLPRDAYLIFTLEEVDSHPWGASSIFAFEGARYFPGGTHLTLSVFELIPF